MNKGIQIVMVTDVDHVQQIAYVHWHKMHNHLFNFKSQRTNKVHVIIEKLEDMVVGYPKMVVVKKIYDNQPEIC